MLELLASPNGLVADFVAPYDRFLVTAEDVVRQRPEVDPELVREIFREVATTLYNGLALDGLDDHDTATVVDGLCTALVAADPAAAVRARAQQTLAEPGDLHDPKAAAASYLFAADMLRL